MVTLAEGLKGAIEQGEIAMVRLDMISHRCGSYLAFCCAHATQRVSLEESVSSLAPPSAIEMLVGTAGVRSLTVSPH
jgi:hypothetical protein